MRRVLAFLFAPRISLGRYCLLAAPLALLPSLALISCVYGALSLAGVDADAWLPKQPPTTVGQAIGAVIGAPALETLLLAGLLALLEKVTSRPILIASLSALVWGVLHGLAGPLWFFGTAWSFFVFSAAYLVWSPQSFQRGYLAAAVPHALMNATVLSLAALAALF